MARLLSGYGIEMIIGSKHMEFDNDLVAQLVARWYVTPEVPG